MDETPTKLTRIRREAAALGKIVAVALVFRAFVAQAYYVPSESMRPTLEIGDHIYVNRLAYVGHGPQPGDVVVFDHPQKHGTDLVKRVVAVGGDVVAGRDGRVWVNGIDRGESSPFSSVTIPPDNLFVMGDNRGNSSDSRFWGTVPLGLVEGRAFVVWWNGHEISRSMHWLR